MPTTAGVPRIAYETHGRSGPPVLLVMGLGMRGLVWRPQVEGLAGTHRLVTFDNRGVGGSEDAPGLWGIREMAGDALSVLDALGWESAHVVGVSMGGMIAQELALLAPGRLRSLTLIATHAGGPLAKLPPIEGLRGFLSVNLLPADQRFSALASLLYPPEFLRTVDHDAMAQRMREQLGSRLPSSVRLRQILSVMRHDTRRRLPSVTLPTLVLRSGRDALVHPREQARLARLVPGSEEHLFPDAGHGLIFQHQAAVNERLAAHFAGHDSTAISRPTPARH